MLQKENINIPQWMKQQNEYSPKTDREGFLTKTMLSILKLFRHFHIEKNEKLSVARAGGRTFLVLGMIVLTALCKNLFFFGTVSTGFFVYLCFVKVDVLKRILSTSITASAFTALVMLPSLILYKSNSIIVLTSKVFLSTGMLALYSQITPWNKITAALRFIKIPSFIIFIIDLTIHYILILGNAAYEMLFALKLRSVGKNKNKRIGFSGILGTIFLKSVAITEETQQAMECRLFNGEYICKKTKINVKDLIPYAVFILYLLLFILVK